MVWAIASRCALPQYAECPPIGSCQIGRRHEGKVQVGTSVAPYALDMEMIRAWKQEESGRALMRVLRARLLPSATERRGPLSCARTT
jgi:hypothetical protein